MTEAERKFREDRALRNAAHALAKAQYAQVREDLAARGIGQRLADKAGEGAKAAADHSLEVANSNRGLVAGTVAAAVLWIFRNPLIAGGKRLWRNYGPGDAPGAQPEPRRDAEPEPSRWRRRFPWHKPKERSSD